MQVPHSKGIANHVVPESCAGHREVPSEALTGVRAGQPLSRETVSLRVTERGSDCLRDSRRSQDQFDSAAVHAEFGACQLPLVSKSWAAVQRRSCRSPLVEPLTLTVKCPNSPKVDSSPPSRRCWLNCDQALVDRHQSEPVLLHLS